MTRVKLSKEPFLHVHRYVMAIGMKRKDHWHTTYRYAVNLEEVAEFRSKAPKGSYIEVFEAHHNFREAWQK